MHLGNVFTALVSWLSARSAGARWILRIEDLDPQRSRAEHARRIEDDLHWLGLDWDEGGTGDIGPAAPDSQSRRSHIYAAAMERLHATGLTYPCFCRRADIMATQAPHQSDGRIVYAGTCRPALLPAPGRVFPTAPHAVRLFVPDEDITFADTVFGPQRCHLATHCGDFVLRRADGAWAYQLAVVVDDAAMGVTEVVRGSDLLLSSAQQIYLYRLLGEAPPRFAHVPLLCNEHGRRLSKRDGSLGMEEMRERYSAGEIIGKLACLAGITPDAAPCRPDELVALFDTARIPPVAEIRVTTSGDALPHMP